MDMELMKCFGSDGFVFIEDLENHINRTIQINCYNISS